MTRFKRWAFALCGLMLGSLASGQVPKESEVLPEPSLMDLQLSYLPLPLPPSESLPASAIYPQLLDKTVIEREKIVLELLEQGHFPAQLRKLKPLVIRSGGHELKFWVMPDYLALGNAADAMLMPLSFVSARRLMEVWGFLLPTKKMVDIIYEQAERRIWPRTYPPSPEMNSMEHVLDHSLWIEGQRYLYPEQNVLTAGHKKDVVLSTRLYRRSHRQAIYGWNNIRGGETIQPLSIWHGDHYVDYSHGLRLIAPWAKLDGKLVKLCDLLLDEEKASLLSDEGPLDVDRLLRTVSRSFAKN